MPPELRFLRALVAVTLGQRNPENLRELSNFLHDTEDGGETVLAKAIVHALEAEDEHAG